jgi:hypothetical protein
MSFITVDFETYYSSDFSLTKLTTEEYVRSPRFEIIGVSVSIDGGDPVWITGSKEDIRTQMLELAQWSTSAVLCHNTLFDGAILEWVLNIHPEYYYDTLCMARALHGVDAGGSLAKLVQRYSLGEKGTEVVNAMNKRREDFTPFELTRYGDYCINDVTLTSSLFKQMAVQFPEAEFDLIDMTLKMFLRPALKLDDALLVDRLEQVRDEKRGLLAGLMQELSCEDEEGVRKKLSSNPQFAAILERRGVAVPMKISPATGKETFALAKNDEGFIALQEHEDPIVQQLCAVRLGTKSTLEESRIERFLGIGQRNRGYLPIPLKYYGAHTGRWAGMDSVNFQNLPSRDKRKKALKNSIIAPPGHVIINCDSSQIEARVLAWLAGQDDLTTAFSEGRDVYSEFATQIYGFKVSKENPVERFVGKTCIGLGSLVLCESGWKPIETVSIADRVWDGEEWVCHHGVVQNGTKKTLELCGLWLTPDHQVWSGTWQRADSLLLDAGTLSRALDIAAENLPSQAMWLAPVVYAPSSSDAIAGRMNTPLITVTLKILNQLGATFARSKQLVKSVIGNTLKLCQMILTGQGYSTVLQQLSPVATQLPVNITRTMDNAEYLFAKSGEMTAQHFCATPKHYQDGTTRIYKWTELITTGAMNRGTSDLSPVSRICTTGERWQTLKPVYDILNSGSRNRFTVLTERGPLIVHNCILGLGYGTGAAKLRHTLKTTPPGADLTEGRCKEIVDLYRSQNYMIRRFWQTCDTLLQSIAGGADKHFIDEHDCVRVSGEGIQLPNGLYIRYPGLSIDEGNYVYYSRKGKMKLWGGAVTENIVQALARIIVGEQLLRINKEFRPVLTVHDAGVWVVPKQSLDYALAFIVKTMSTPPSWCEGLPVACEAKYGASYGEC